MEKVWAAGKPTFSKDNEMASIKLYKVISHGYTTDAVVFYIPTSEVTLPRIFVLKSQQAIGTQFNNVYIVNIIILLDCCFRPFISPIGL